MALVGGKQMSEQKTEIKRWTAKRRQALILEIIRGETTPVDAARKHGLTVAEVTDWHEKALAAMENGLRSKPKDEEVFKDEQIKKLKQKVGDLVMDIDIYKEAMKGHPFGQRALRELDES